MKADARDFKRVIQNASTESHFEDSISDLESVSHNSRLENFHLEGLKGFEGKLPQRQDLLSSSLELNYGIKISKNFNPR